MPSNAAMQLDRFLKRKEVEAATGYSRSSIYRLIGLGEFPAPIAFNQRAVRWRESDVAAWQQRMLEQVEAA
jgi:prophage regulatory protein